MKKSTKKWWKEGKDHIAGKNILRAVAKQYGASAVEEELFPVDLHKLEPELYEKRHIISYQADLLISKKDGKQVYKVIAEVDGKYHEEHLKEDELRDARIEKVYGIQVVRFKKEQLLKGQIRPEDIAYKLGLAPLVTGRSLYAKE